MPRINNSNQHEYYGRTSGSGHNIRKVSFMNGSGRIRKDKRSNQVFVRYVADDDVEMGTGERQPWKGGKSKHRKNFNGRPGSPGVRNTVQLRPLKPSDWYQVTIMHGAKYGKTYLLQMLLKHLSPLVFIPNSFSVSGKHAVFYVDEFDVAVNLRNASRKLHYDDGYLMEIRVREGHPPPIQLDEKIKELIKRIMAKRYIAENKALDLSKFSSDPDFQGDIYCPLSRPPIMKAVWQIINENISDIVAVNLNSNKISIIDESCSVEIRKLKNLKIVHLADNKIKSIHLLSVFKDLELTELVLKNNPFVDNFKDNAHYVRYGMGVTEIRKKFPKLTKLDDLELPPVISFDVTDEAKLPTPQAAFMCNPEGRGIVKVFLSQYFALYDSENRLNLAQAYHDNSSFSLCSYYPPSQKASVVKLNQYIQESRNLLRVQDYPRRKSRLHTGKQNIVQRLSHLPKTQHDLSSFVVDLPLFTPALINLCVNGVFREPNSSTTANFWPVRHFSRTFLIVPVNQGFCIINDMLSVTNATESEVQCSFKEETQNAAILQSPSSSQPGPSDVSVVSSGLQSIQLDESVRLQMVQTLATRTGMNLSWSKKCLDETQWDFDRAIWTFNELQSKGSIPAEAFVK